MTIFNELFPNVIVLALDKRYDKYTLPLIRHMKDRFDIDLQAFIAGDGELLQNHDYDHIDTPACAPRLPGSSGYPTWFRPSAYNTFLCHQKMVRLAQQQNWPHVLMLEDDVFFEAHAETTLEKLSNQIRTLAWDLLYVGFCAPEHRTDINREDCEPHIVPSGSCCGGLHCLAIKASAYDAILDFEPLACMDVMVERLPNRYTVVPKVGEQKPGYSYVEQTIFARPDCTRKLERVRERWPNV